MRVHEDKQSILELLFTQYKQKGFVTEEIILNSVTKYDLPLDEIDNVCDTFLSMGGVILDESNVDEAEFSNYSRTDYNKLFNQTIKIEPILKPFINEIQKILPPQRREFENLLAQTKNNNDYAKERIIKMYLRQVIKIAVSNHEAYGIPLADAIQDGCIGLITATEKYDIGRQGLFAGYAAMYIRQKIIQYGFVTSNCLYFPVNIKFKLFSAFPTITKFCENCYCDGICNTVLTILSKKLECDNEEAIIYFDYLLEDQSIDELVINDENLFSDKGCFEEQILNNLVDKKQKYSISKIFDILDEQEKIIISMHFGLFNKKECSLEELGQQFNLTRERIRQIELNAFRKIRNLPNIKKLKDLLN